MKKNIANIVDNLRTKKNTNKEEYDKFIKYLDFKIDADFLNFIKEYNGCSGPIGKDNYISFWTIEDMMNLNPYYSGEQKYRDHFFFSSDGGSLGYCFNKKTGNIFGIYYDVVDEENPIVIASSFEDFIIKLKNSNENFPYN